MMHGQQNVKYDFLHKVNTVSFSAVTVSNKHVSVTLRLSAVGTIYCSYLCGYSIS
jgi:hypothetical protein